MSGMIIGKKCPQCGRIYKTTFPNSNPWAEDFLETGICPECWNANEYGDEDFTDEEDSK